MIRGVFVLAFVGCWRSSPPPVEPEPEPIADAPRRVERAQPASPQNEVPAQPSPPVAPAAPVVLTSTPHCPSGTGVLARVIGIAIAGSSTIVKIAAGSARGVAANWTVLQQSYACTIVRVDQHVTTLDCQATPNQVKTARVAVLCAP